MSPINPNNKPIAIIPEAIVPSNVVKTIAVTTSASDATIFVSNPYTPP